MRHPAGARGILVEPGLPFGLEETRFSIYAHHAVGNPGAEMVGERPARAQWIQAGLARSPNETDAGYARAVLEDVAMRIDGEVVRWFEKV